MTTKNTKQTTGAKRGPKPGTEAAKRGGSAVVAKYGREFFSTIGKKGGAEVAKRGSEWYAEIGRKGGQTTKRTQGPGFYERIGHIGGSANSKSKASE